MAFVDTFRLIYYYNIYIWFKWLYSYWW